MTVAPLSLDAQEPVAIGSKSLCYVHPADRTLMVKVLWPEARLEAARRRNSRWQRRLMPEWHFDEQHRELRAYRRLYARHGEALWRHVPRFHGTVETDRGRGIVTQFVRDDDGRAGVNLTRLIPEGYDAAVRAGVDALRDFVLSRELAVRDFHAGNVMIARRADGSAHAWLVDGFEDTEFVPVSPWLGWRRRRRARLRLAQFDADIRHRIEVPGEREVFAPVRDETCCHAGP